MTNVLLFEIGDKVVVNGSKKGEVAGFHEIALSERSCFKVGDYCPGVYRDPMLARVRMEDGKVVDVYSSCLKAVDFEEYVERLKMVEHCRKRFIRRFPEALFCEGDQVQIKLESLEKIRNLIEGVIEGHRYRKPQMSRLGINIGEEPRFDLSVFFVLSIDYWLDSLGVSNSYINISDNPDNFHWHIAVEEDDLELLKHGEIWKIYHRK